MTTTPSNARALYEQIIAAPDRGLLFLQNLVTTEAEENEWMEFKGVPFQAYAVESLSCTALFKVNNRP